MPFADTDTDVELDCRLLCNEQATHTATTTDKTGQTNCRQCLSHVAWTACLLLLTFDVTLRMMAFKRATAISQEVSNVAHTAYLSRQIDGNQTATSTLTVAAPAPLITANQHIAYILRSPAPIGQMRYEFAHDNLERGFRGFFTYKPFLWSPASDPRLAYSHDKATFGNLLSFLDMWTDIWSNPAHAALPETHWFFIFEDDVNVAPTPHTDANFSYTPILQEFLATPAVVEKGIFYFGVCAPNYISSGSDAPDVLHSSSAPWFKSRLGSGLCAHAMGMTKARARVLWLDMIVNGHMNQHKISDQMLRLWGKANGGAYIFGSNARRPNYDGSHQGILFQDRDHVPSVRDPSHST